MTPHGQNVAMNNPDRLRQIRVALAQRGWSWTHLARLMGVSSSWLYMVAHGVGKSARVERLLVQTLPELAEQPAAATEAPRGKRA